MPLRAFVFVVAVGIAFALFAARIEQNPPGFYVDESALSYNGYLVSQTGAGETGELFPLFFPVYSTPFTQYANPTQIYLLAILFKITGPSILAARLLAAACVFAACLLLGLLARRITGNDGIGLIVCGLAMTTPWLFEVGRVVLETFCYPLVVVLLLWSVYRASAKEKWNWIDCGLIVLSLALVTYSYTIGRLLGPLLALGLVVFVTGRKRLVSVLVVWAAYAVSMLPFLVYWFRHPELSNRFRTLTYVRPGRSVPDIAVRFVSRLLEDLNPWTMLIVGDINPRHHVWGAAAGSILIGTFILSVIGIAAVLIKHRRERRWLYVLFGLAASVVPGALTVDAFHTLRMVAYPVFLLMLTVPALEWLTGAEEADDSSLNASRALRLPIAGAVLGLAAVQAGFFFYNYHAKGADRAEFFDAGYKVLYDAAVDLPERPIYLVDGYWGPAYVHAFWYATLEGRSREEFVHLPYGSWPEENSIVLSSEKDCSRCVLIAREGQFMLYRMLGAEESEGQSETR